MFSAVSYVTCIGKRTNSRISLLLFLNVHYELCFNLEGGVLGQDTSEPSLVLVKPRKDMNNVSCRRDMTEILLKAV